MAKRVGTDPTYGFSINPWAMLFLVVVAIGSYYLANHNWGGGGSERLPKFYPVGTSANERDTIYQRIPSFTLTNQQGREVHISKYDSLDAIYLIHAFELHAGLVPACEEAARRLAEVSSKYEVLRMLSLVLDTVAVPVDTLQELAARLGAEAPKWSLLSGDPAYMRTVVQNGLHISIRTDSSGLQVAPRWVLIDRMGVIRGRYEDCAPEEMDRLTNELPDLLSEYQAYRP
ncbi:MAG: hypothetical protein D6730_00460 [Bacteroidetes bacterium]|nr:MAG: hypothetical protein D6730_00460 [Bacteroidota bacterium]